MADETRIPVIVTTVHRGVFFGMILPEDKEKKSIELTCCRNAMFWSQQTGGFLGLAATGPASGSRIGAKAPRVLLHDVTSVTDCTEIAAAAWNKE